ncbi:MAG: site-specific integrase [Desulfobulbaceae bacterium]|nr:site-specific integrase [Desulfobulbaceae bacterium]
MAIRPHPTKSRKNPGKHWHIDVYVDGKRKFYPFEGSFDDAVEFERALRQAPADSTHGVAPRIKDLVLPFLQFYGSESSPATVRDASNCLKGPLIIVFGNLQPKQLTVTLFNQYRQKRLDEGVTKRTINKELSYLSSCLKWAAKEGFCQALPFRIPRYSAKMTKADPARPLTNRQIDALLQAIESEYKLLFLLMADAGLRKAEALNLTAEDIDENHRTIKVKGKGSKTRFIPFTTDRLVAALQGALEKRHSGPLTVNGRTDAAYDSIKKALIRAGKKAGIQQAITHHLLRHSFLTNAAEKGVSPAALQQLAGHSDIRTTMGIYVNVRRDFVRDEVEKLRG